MPCTHTPTLDGTIGPSTGREALQQVVRRREHNLSGLEARAVEVGGRLGARWPLDLVLLHASGLMGWVLGFRGEGS